MKKYFISLLMMAAPVTIMAQFQVLSDGSAKLLRTQSSSYSYLGVGSLPIGLVNMDIKQ